jgi:hypothetical protein
MVFILELAKKKITLEIVAISLFCDRWIIFYLFQN